MPSATSSRLSGRARDASMARHQVARRDRGEALELHQLLDRQLVEVGRVVDEPRRDELEHPLLTQPLDVHGRARRVVGDALHPLGRAVDVRAVGVALAGQADERLAARRARRRELPLRLAPRRHAGPVRDRSHDLGDDVARLAHDHQVARAHVLRRHLVLVVQRGHAHGGAADEDRLEPGERRGPARPPDRHHDVEQPGGALLGRELEGDGPAGRPRRGAEHGVQRQVVDLGDDAVDLVGQVVARRGQLAARATTASMPDAGGRRG